ncbi:hypothetical protein [Tolypothrix sp. VBCCA 56010]|uniref:hypothetical protein n=1 Tax=Tolypothrix sp. VBCCA 56010 TaxID=3137731 RepID=UPI003D7EFB67
MTEGDDTKTIKITLVAIALLALCCNASHSPAFDGSKARKYSGEALRNISEHNTASGRSRIFFEFGLSLSRPGSCVTSV